MTPEHLAALKAGREAAKGTPRRKTPSLRKAIDGKCRGCIVDDSVGGGGSWRQQVEACTSYNCELYPVRPISSSPKETSHANSI